MSTVRDLIKGALKKIGVLSIGESISAEDANDALSTLSQLLRSWNNDSLIVNGNQIESFTLTPGQSVYTMGVGGDFNTSPPVRIENVFIKYDDNAEYPVRMVDNEGWGNLTTKTTTSTLPTTIYIDDNFPLRTVSLYPVPSQAVVLKLHTFRKFSGFTSLSDEVSLAEGMDRAIIYNLALELAPDYGKEPSALIYNTAMESLALIQRNHNNPGTLKTDIGLLSSGGWDWRQG